MKICFAASSGGHFEQLLMLEPLMKQHDCFLLTEKTLYQAPEADTKTYYLPQVNRKELTFLPKIIWTFLSSLFIFFHEKPDLVICTGVLAMVPMCRIAKWFGKKFIYIESFAKISSPTKSGKYLHTFADQTYVQWESMKEFYPEALCLGGIY